MHRDRRGREGDRSMRVEVSRVVKDDRRATRWLLLFFFHDEQMDSSDGARCDGSSSTTNKWIAAMDDE